MGQDTGAWYWWSKSDALKRSIARLTHKDVAHFTGFLACLILQCFDLGKCVRSEHSSA